MTALLLVAAGGAVGAVSRHLLDVALGRRLGPGPSLGVLVANLLGSFLLGTVVGYATANTLDREFRLLVVVGFCGAFTTFSTLMAELVGLLEAPAERSDRPDGRGGFLDRHGAAPAIGWALVSVLGGVGAAAIGWTLGTVA